MTFFHKSGRAPFGMRFTLSALLLFLLSTTAYYKFYHHHLDLPSGCDEFGYLQLADRIANGVVFDSQPERAFTPELISFLQKQGLAYKDYAWLIAPHAYHVEKTTQKVINQYPPGTSIVLSFFEKEHRQVMFPAATLFLFAVFPLLACLLLTGEWNRLLFGVNLVLLFIMTAMVISPFMNELHRINSVAPTYGMLLAAGILMEKRPGMSLFLIGLSVVFRLPNVMIAMPVFGYYLFSNVSQSSEKVKTLIRRFFAGAVYFGMSGVALYFLYVFLLLGNPFLPTYSALDQQFVTWQGILHNVRFYFNPTNQWFMANLLPLIGVLALGIAKKKNRFYLVCLTSVPVINYLFFLTHSLRNGYYPYASGLFLWGTLLYLIWDAFETRPKRQLIAFSGLVLLLCATLINSLNQHDLDHRIALRKQAEPYQQCFGDVDVVWAELHSSSVEYATDAAGFRYQWGPTKARRAAMRWLNQNDYRQAIWVDDLKLSKATIRKEIDSAGLKMSETRCSQLGTVYRISG